MGKRKTFGGLLRDWRDRQGLSQKSAAALVGVKQTTWMRWEANAFVPGADDLKRIVGTSDLSADDLLASIPDAI